MAMKSKPLEPGHHRRKSRKVDPVTALRLKAKGYTNKDIADKYGVVPSAVSNTLSKVRALILNPAELKEYRDREVNLIDSTKARLLLACSDEKAEKASLLQLTTAFCQLTDKSLLMQGKATANIDIRSMASHFVSMREDLEKQIADLERGVTDGHISGENDHSQNTTPQVVDITE
jgi:predicted transcriptional regulator